MRRPHRSALTTLFVLVTACGGDDGLPSNGSQPDLGQWDTRASLATARQEMPSALIGGRIYTPGGYDAQGATVAVLEIYDVAADRWTAGPAMPDGRNHPGVAAASGRVFVTGGYTASGPRQAESSTRSEARCRASFRTRRSTIRLEDRGAAWPTCRRRATARVPWRWATRST